MTTSDGSGGADELAGPPTIGGYQVLSHLVDGRTGRVLLGVDDTGRHVAITLIDPRITADPAFVQRFREEVRAAAAAPPSFLATVLDADTAAEQPYMVTTFADGPSLAAYVDDHGPLGPDSVAALAGRLADGLDSLHVSGLVHRQLDPSRIVLAQDGPRLVDSTIARAAALNGDPAYTSPEQAMGRSDVTAAADIFALGATLAFAAGGRSPFAADSVPATLAKVTGAEADLHALRSPVLETVRACLRKNPTRRPTAGQVRQMLAGLPVELPVEPHEEATARHGGVEPPVSYDSEPGASYADEPTTSYANEPTTSYADEPTVVAPARPRAANLPLNLPPLPTGPTERPARRRWPLIAAAAAVVILLAVVVGLVVLPGGSGSTSPTAAAPTSAAEPGPAGPSSTAGARPDRPSPADGAVVADVTADPRFSPTGGVFSSPSGNITCSLTPERVRCDVAERGWQLPTPPASDCTSFGHGVALDNGAEIGALTCGLPAGGQTKPVPLEYDTGVRMGSVVCVSKQTGMVCQDTDSGHGFQVSKADYQVY